MHPIYAGASAPKRITALHEFFKFGDGNLFAVQPGVSTIDALEQASVFLCIAQDAINRLAQDTDNMSAFGALYLTEIAKGVVDSAVESAYRDQETAKAAALEPSLPAVLESLIEESQRGVAEGRTKRGQTFHTGRVSALEEVLEHVRGMNK
ncbi:MAG: DUF3077 domain-containing protein [Proteobacteria bacterium]|nr:DUF3077 domain-containing protein [Pseudomonadota bacterium]